MALLGVNLPNGPPRTTVGRARTTGMPDASPVVDASCSCATLLAKYADVGSWPRWADSSRADGDSQEPQVTDELVTTTRPTPAAAAGVGRVVVTSSSVTCGSCESPSARDESAHLGQEPTSAYFASKVAQEREALTTGEASGIPVVLALPTVVLGGPFGRLAPSNAIVLRYLLDATRSTYLRVASS